MWINCDFGFDCKTRIKYIVDDYSFRVDCTSEYSELGQNVTLSAHFYNSDKYINFELGAFTCDNGVYKFEKKYSMSYFVSCGIDIESFSHFSINSDGSLLLKAYPATDNSTEYIEDTSIIRAKETLDSLKPGCNFAREVNDCIAYINKQTKKYKSINIPLLNDFDWFVIDKQNEFFNLSSLLHLLCSENYEKYLSRSAYWYFGKSKDDRIYAAAVKCDLGFPNPFSNADDCAVKYSDSKTDDIYYVVGILLLDDGQYFCRLN